jgi:hypothetical protein
MAHRFTQVLLKICATGLLAAAFVALFINVPFMSQFGKSKPNAIVGADGIHHLKLPALNIGTAAVPPRALPGSQNQNLPGLQPAMSLFNAHFAQSGGTPEFVTAEHLVDGVCEGAGRRYIEQVCPECKIMEGSQQTGQPSMLLWTKADESSEVLRSATADCTATNPDGRVVVSSLSFGEDGGNPASGSQQMALDIVPLLPGSKRLSTAGMGGWMATMDEVSDPENALDDMTAALHRKGWQDAPGQPLNAIAGIGEHRVFSGEGQATCIIYLSATGGTIQLVTVIGS